MAVVRYRTSALLRRRWRATLVMILLAGLAGGVVLATWAAGRRGRTAYDRFVRYVDYPQATMWFCSPETTMAQAVAQSGLCAQSYDASAERDFVARLPQVTSVSISRLYPVEITVAGQTFPAAISSTVGGNLVSANGTPLVIRGHLPRAADDLAVNEVGVSAVRGTIRLGQPVTIRPLDFRTFQPIDVPPEHLHLSGITRFPLDLAASVRDPEAADGVAFVSPAWSARYGKALPVFGNEVQARLRPGARAEDVYRAVRAHWPNRYVDTFDTHDATAATVQTAIGYEADALRALAAALAIAAVIFVGQTLARQAQQEQQDLPALRNLGLTRSEAVGTAMLRALPVGLGAAGVAIATAWVSSAWTPVGLAARAEPDRGLRADPLVFVFGGGLVALATAACLVVPVWRRQRRSSRGAVAGSHVAAKIGLPPVGVAGVGMATARRRGTMSLGMALAGLTIGTAVIVAAASVALSLHRLGHDATRYGVRWDATASLDGGSPATLIAAAQKSPAITQAGAIWERDGRVDQQSVNLIALSAVKASEPSAWTKVTAGRVPQTDDETALGGKTMRELQVRIGDTVMVQATEAVAPTHLKVVGRVEFNDGTKLDTGDGALVPMKVLEALRNISFDALVVRVQPGTPVTKALAPMVAAGARVRTPTPSTSVRNLQRIGWLPWALAAAVVVLAIAALAHALVTSARANRRELAVLRSLGFTTTQVRRAASCESLTVALAAIVMGVPLGLLFGSWGWSRLMDQLGITDPASVPPMALAVIPAGVAAVALVLSWWPGRCAATTSPGEALRAE